MGSARGHDECVCSHCAWCCLLQPDTDTGSIWKTYRSSRSNQCSCLAEVHSSCCVKHSTSCAREKTNVVQVPLSNLINIFTRITTSRSSTFSQTPTGVMLIIRTTDNDFP